MLRIDRADFELIYAISLELSFSSAARRLGISGSAVSQRLKKLEKSIGHPLIQRPGPFKFTEAGKRMLVAANAVLAGVANLESDLLQITAPSQQLSIMTNLSVAIDDLPHVLERLKDSRPDLQVRVVEGTISATIKEVIDGNIDAGIIFNNHQVPGLVCHPYRTENLCIITPISHALASYDRFDFILAAQHSFIGAGETNNLTTIMNTAATRAGITLRYSMEMPSYEMQAHLVGSTNLGIALVLGNVAKRFAQIYPIKIIQLTDNWARGEYVVCTRNIDLLSDQCIEFLRLIKRRFSMTIKTV